MKTFRYVAAFALMLCADAAAVFLLLGGGSLHEALLCVLMPLILLLPAHQSQADKEKDS